MANAWTAERVEIRLVLAADVLRRTKDVEQRYLRGTLRSRMPEVAWDAASAYAAAFNAMQAERERMEKAGVILEGRLYDARKPGRAGPSPAEISRMEEVLIGTRERPAWLMYLSPRWRRMVWRRITGCPWWNMAAIEKRSERTVQRWYREALTQIADELDTLGVQP